MGARIFYSLLLLLASKAFGQVNIDSVSHVDYQQLHSANLNDVWGYVDETNVEYAIVGTTKGTSIISLQDPANPSEVFWEPGAESIWRDPCVHNDYAYVTTEAESGLLIIDMTSLPAAGPLPTNYYFGEAGSTWSSAHTCFVDENGYAYIFGSNRGNGGVIILDVHTDPMNPVEVGSFDNWYVHDGFVRNDTMYLAHIVDGFFSIVDVSDKANPVLLGTKSTPNDFTHNIWPTNVGDFVFTTDEVSGAYIASYNISDPNAMYEVDRIQSSPGAGVIPHNAHVLGDYLITSYYSDGITIHDVKYPYNMVQVGSYDTYPGQTVNYDGCWGVYPFLPSGLILASDITEGLFILNPQYVQAAYLEGIVTDANTLAPLSGVAVQIVGHDQVDHSIANGRYATGILTAGSYNVTYSKVGYYPQTHPVSLLNGEITLEDVQLVPIPPYSLTVTVLDASNGNPITNAKVRLIADLITHEGLTNAGGEEYFTLFYQEQYRVLVGKWGYVTACFDSLIDQNTISLTVELNKGYYDDFEFDFGWMSAGNASTGLWERGKPFATSSGSNPGFDAEFDCGDQAYITGNAHVLHPDIDDVDGGTAVLVSPIMNLATYTDPHINYARWFYNRYGAIEQDSFKVMVTNGTETAWIDFAWHDTLTDLMWVTKSIRLLDFIIPSSTVQFQFFVSDLDPDVNITEGGVDYFFVSESNVLGLQEVSNSALRVFPNPFTNTFLVSGLSQSNGDYQIIDLNGREVKNGLYSGKEFEIDATILSPGCYLLKIDDRVIRVLKD